MEFVILEPGNGTRYNLGYHLTTGENKYGDREVILCWFNLGSTGEVLRVSHLPNWDYIADKMNCGQGDAKVLRQALRCIFRDGTIGEPDWVAKDLENPQVIMTLAAAGGADNGL